MYLFNKYRVDTDYILLVNFAVFLAIPYIKFYISLYIGKNITYSPVVLNVRQDTLQFS